MKRSCMLLLLMLSLLCPLMGENALYEKRFSTTDAFLRDWEVHDTVNAQSGPSGWVVENGELIQKSNIYRAGGDEYAYYEGTHAALRTGTDWTDYEYSVDFRIYGDDDGVGVLFRYLDPEHFYRFITVQDPGNKGPFRRLQVRDKKGYRTLAEVRKGYDSSKAHNVRIVAVKEAIKVYFDGELVFDVKDDTYSYGRIGVQSYAEQPGFYGLKIMKSSGK